MKKYQKYLLGAVLALALIPAMPQTSEAKVHGVDRLFYDALVTFYTTPTAANQTAMDNAAAVALAAGPQVGSPIDYNAYVTREQILANLLFGIPGGVFIMPGIGAPASPA